MPDIAERLETATSKVDLDHAVVARLLDTNPRTVSRWIQRQAAPRPDARERLLELIAVLERLSGVMHPEPARDWLFTPNPLLEHHKPVDLLRDGDYRRVLGAIDALGEGVFVQPRVVLPRLVSAIDELDRVAYAGEAYRHVSPQYNPLSGAGARTHGGRWNPPQSFPTLYLGCERDAVIAEFHRLVRRSGREPRDFLPRRFYRYEVRLSELLDLREASSRHALRLSDAALSADDLAPCQAVGEAAHHVGCEGIIAPSATGAGTVIAVYFDRLTAEAFVHDIDFELWEVA